MKYVFFGSPRFAVIVLERLIDAGMAPSILVCNPDRPVGRKQIITPPPTKELMVRRGLDVAVLQPEKITSSFAQELKVLDPDFFVVAAYAQIIPETILEVPKFGTLGVHPSLLPKYRGSTPIQSVILNGEEKTGSTIYLMDAKMDHGAIIAQETIDIHPTETYDLLEMRLANLSGGLLAATIPDILAGKATPKIQDENQATFTKKFETQDAYIDERDLQKAQEGDSSVLKGVYGKIRGLNPEPGAWTMKDGKRLKLLEAIVENGRLVLKKTQQEGELPKAL